MKLFFVFLFSIVFISYASSQCILNAELETNNLDCGDTASFIFTYNEGNYTVQDFNSTPGPWLSSPGAQFDNPYIPSPTNDTYFWMGPSSSFPISLTTSAYNVSGGGEVCFDFVYAGYGGIAPMEQPDLYNEGISLQYNAGFGWVDMIYYPPTGGSLSSNPGSGVTVPALVDTIGPYETWSSVCVPIPLGAQGPSTSFQWIQSEYSGSCCDHWGLDNINISIVDSTYDLILLNNDSIIGQNEQFNFQILTHKDSIFSFLYTNGIDSCYDTALVNYKNIDLGPDLILDCIEGGLEINIEGVSENASFSWVPSNNISDTNSLNPFLNPLTDEEYILNTECGSDTLSIDVIRNYNLNITSDTAICIGDSINLFATGAETYTWSSNSNSLNNTQAASQFILPSGFTNTFTVVSDSAGCEKTKTLEVKVSNLDFVVFISTPPDCNNNFNGELIAVVNGYVDTFYFSFFDGDTMTYHQTGDFLNLQSGTYTITAYDALNCPIDTTITFISEPELTIDSVLVTKTTSCTSPISLSNLEVFTSNSLGAFYNIGSGNTSSSNLFTGLVDGIYNVEVSKNGCTVNKTVVISNPEMLDLNVASQTPVSCSEGSDGQINLQGVGGLLPYRYSNDNINYQVIDSIGNLSSGVNKFYVQDTVGCIDSLEVFISEINELNLTMSSIIYLNATNPGSATVLATGGTSPYSYLWNDAQAQTLSTASNLQAGIYSVQVRDKNLCFASAEIEVKQFNSINNSLELSNFEIFPNPSNGFFHIQFDNFETQYYTFSIVDIYGKEIFTQKENSTNKYFKTIINLNELENSVYFLIISDGISKKIEKLLILD